MSAKEETLNAIHEAIANNLLKKIRDGEATGTDLNVARQFLKDNQITCGPKNKPVNDLLDQLQDLPDFESEKNTYN